jgi:two-component system, cell cycle sensor histidine kinase and response regulator CckA
MTINAQRQLVIKSLPPFNIRRKIALKESSLAEIVEAVEKSLPKNITGHIRTKTEYTHGNLRMMADSALLEEALMNLVKNAIEAMPAGGLLTIGTDQARLQNEPSYIIDDYNSLACAIVSITDSGTGIDKETMGRMFEPYFTTKPESGRGLGLSIAHSIIKQHGGCIKVESALGKGTTIKVYLPLVRAATDQTGTIPLPVSFFAKDMEKSKGRSVFAAAG